MNLILIRHAAVNIVPDQASKDWALSEAGRRSCQALIREIAPYAPEIMLTSVEAKAQETGQIVAQGLHIPRKIWPDIHEHDRSGVGFMTNPTVFHAVIADFFANPDDLVFGQETAKQAHERFQCAVHNALAQHPDQTIALATHGTVMTLFIAHLRGQAPFDLWSRLKMPAYAVFSLPNFELLDLVLSLET